MLTLLADTAETLGSGTTQQILAVIVLALGTVTVGLALYVRKLILDSRDEREALKIQLEKVRAQQSSGLVPSEHAWLKELHEMHDVRDTNGVLQWWVPRAWAGKLDHLVDGLRKNTEAMERKTEAIDTLRGDVLTQLQAEREKLDALNAEQRAMLKGFLEALKRGES